MRKEDNKGRRGGESGEEGREEGETGGERETGFFRYILYTFIYFQIPLYSFKCLYILLHTFIYPQIPSYTFIYFGISNIRNMRANVRPKKGHNSGCRAFPEVRI